MELNENQILAVNHVKGPCLVLAGPGSGKTAVLTNRIKHLCESGIPPEKILVITFTKAASFEMKQRFDLLCPDSLPVNFGTFHSCFYNILRSEYSFNNSSILDGGRKIALIKEAVSLCKLEPDGEDFYNEVSRQFSFIKNKGIKTDDKNVCLNENIFKILNKYEFLKNKYKYIDFDDMLTKTYELFISDNSALSRWQNRFSYFLIDEAQDMNKLSYDILKMLSERNKNIFLVGDDDQSIYGFRGSDAGILKQFINDFPDCRQILLNINYRCPSNIVKKSLSLISRNEFRFDKEILSSKNEGFISINCLDTENDEAALITDKITEIKDLTPNASIAVLYRNHSLARCLIEKLIENNISFYLKENMPNIYTHFIMQDFEAFFFIALGNITRERILRIMNKPNHFFSRNSLDNSSCDFKSMLEFYKDNPIMSVHVRDLINNIHTISRLRPFAAANFIRKTMGYDEYLKEKALELRIDPDNYLETADMFCNLVRKCNTLKSAIDHLYTLRRKVDYLNDTKKQNREGVALLTLHASKGLEFDNVFILGINEGCMPPVRCTSKESVEEERRLFYVGITRAKENLYLTGKTHKNQDYLKPSRFLSELEVHECSRLP